MRGVLFDATGTLIELAEPVGETYHRHARAYGVNVEAARIEAAFQHTFRSMPAMVFPGASTAETVRLERAWWRELVRRTFRVADARASFSDFERYFDEVFRRFAEPAAWHVGHGAHEVLSELRARGLRTGMVSNFDHRLPALLDGLDLGPLFDIVIRPSDAGAAKPDPRIFAVALERLGIPAAEAVYVGDDAAHDVEGARAAGLRAIDVRTLTNLSDIVARVEAMKGRVPAS